MSRGTDITLNRAEKITELTIIRIGPELFRASGVIGQYDVITADPQKAAEEIVKWNWRQVSAAVFMRAGHKCQECLKLKPLSAHHVVFRSHGRRDTIDNLRALCSECHDHYHS